MPWGSAVSLWWGYTWRMAIFALIGGVGSAFLRLAGLQLGTIYLLTLLVWPAISLLAMRLAVSSHAGRLLGWVQAAGYWWSFVWRICLYGALIGIVTGGLVSAVVGQPQEHPSFLPFAWLLTLGPAAIVTFRQVLHAQSPTVESVRGSS